MHFLQTPTCIERHHPMLGEYIAEVLREYGLDPADFTTED